MPVKSICASFNTPVVTAASTDLCDTDPRPRRGRPTAIDKLPETILLAIFDFYRKKSFNTRLWKWHLLAHVCRRWREIVFSSPLRLNLRLLCTSRTSIENFSIWPTFPLRYFGRDHPDRVCGVRFRMKGLQLGEVATPMGTSPHPCGDCSEY